MTELDGILFEYNRNSIAFKSKIESEKAIILIPGLGDNILSLPYVTLLYKYCKTKKVKLVIPQLRSMPNFTITPIEHDLEDLAAIIKTIKGEIILLGHSTGCNDILLFIRQNKLENIKGIVLQGPVSDIEAESQLKIEYGLNQIKKSADSKYIEFNDEIWLKERFISLYTVNEKEDLFSSYLDDKSFSQWKGKVPILSILSEKDEYCLRQIPEKFELAGMVCMIPGADHSISSKTYQECFLDAINTFFNEIKFLDP
ncbi:hypothetical protein GINT2_000182 [Glugoides intestinalis]